MKYNNILGNNILNLIKHQINNIDAKSILKTVNNLLQKILLQPEFEPGTF